jgi:hypothetical protein
MVRRRRFAIALLAVAGLAACGGSPPTQPVATKASPAATVASASLTQGQAVPVPTGRPVLTVTGKITRRNQGRALVWDVATLDRLGLAKVTLFEPWTKKTLSFQGVWLADLMKVAGAETGARSVHLTALDDYAVDLSAADVGAGGIMIATATGAGKGIPIEDGGPTRIVFASGTAAGKNPDQWIWSLKSLDVR